METVIPHPVPQQTTARTYLYFWSAFLITMLLPLGISAVAPLVFAIFVPLAGVPFFFLHKFLFGTWPLLKPRIPGLLPLFVVLGALMLASAAWSVTPEASFERAQKIIGLMIGCFACVAVASHCPRDIWQRFCLIFPFVALCASAVTMFDIYAGLPILSALHTNYQHEIRPDAWNKNTSVFVMGLPIFFYLSMKGRSVLLTGALIAMTALVFVTTTSQASQLSMIVLVLALIGCVFFLEKLTIRAAFLILAFIALMLPFIAPTAFDLIASHVAEKDSLMDKASMALRLENYDFLSRRILENPWTGFGMDSTRAMKFDTQELYFKNDSIMHPHNVALQMWIEFGLFGVAWTLVFLGFLYVLFMRMNPAARRLSFLLFCGITVYLLVSWSIWASWLVALIFYLVALCRLATGTSTDRSIA